MITKFAKKLFLIGGLSLIVLVLAGAYLLGYVFNLHDPLSQTLKKTLPAYVSGFRYASIYDRDQAVGIGLKLDSKLT
ncbi:MAG: hypothetical protein ACM3NH_00875, partial [Candidatus Saccharibacteria bacterium]